MAAPATIPFDDLQAHFEDTLDRSQAAPVRLTRPDRPHAVLVSADWFAQAERAMAALHGDRRVLASADLSDDDRAFVEANGPNATEIGSDRWQA